MKFILVAAVAVTSLTGAAAASTLTDVFTSYYAFGDSLTDDGKLGALGAPSLEGRFSNGPTYAEYIAAEFSAVGHDTGNLALGGATGGDVNPAAFSTLSTFAGQITTFTDALTDGFGLPTGPNPPQSQPNGPAPGSNPLVSVLFGANDFFQGQSVIGAADAVADGIRTIGSITSHTFDDFLVVSLPDIGGTPAFSDPSVSAAATAATNAFNERLALNIIDLRNEGYNIIELDSASVVQEILDDVALGGPQYGVTDSTRPCTASMSVNGPSCVDLGVNPDTLLFSDAVHPNGVAQRLLGERAIATIEASVPVPAALPLLLTAFAGFGFVATRRQRTA